MGHPGTSEAKSPLSFVISPEAMLWDGNYPAQPKRLEPALSDTKGWGTGPGNKSYQIS